MADPKSLSRDQLAKFLPDAEAIKRFERLFTVAGDLTPADVVTLYRLAQEASTDAGIADAKANDALGALNRIANSLELISMAGPIVSSQADDQFLTSLVLPQEVNPLPPSVPVSVDTLSDSIIGTPVAGQLLIYDATLKAWKNAVLTAGTNVIVTNADGSVTIAAVSSAVETHAAASKTTPVDADEIPLADSATAFSLKKLTWANLKATLATWINSNLIPASFTTLASSGSTTLGDATTDTLNVGGGGIIKDAQGNVGLGVTPSAWYPGGIVKGLQIGNAGPSIAAGTNSLSADKYYWMTNNGYVDNTFTWRYTSAKEAVQYRQFNGTHNWGTAPSGSAGTPITFTDRLILSSTALTLDGIFITPGGTSFHTTNTALTNGAGAAAGTLLNSPVAGNPTKWIGINDNGTIRHIPTW